MKMNRIQFQQGLSLNQFFAQYGKEQQCESILEYARWPHGFICPKCNSNQHGTYWRNHRVKIFQCKACRGQTTLTEGTIFHSSKLPLTTWFQARPKGTLVLNCLFWAVLSRVADPISTISCVSTKWSSACWPLLFAQDFPSPSRGWPSSYPSARTITLLSFVLR